MITRQSTENQLQLQVEHLLAEVEREIADRRRGMMFYDSSIDALIKVRDELAAIVNGQEAA